MKVPLATTPDKDKRIIEIAIEMKNKFYLHWAILCGATLTLIIPFLIQANVLSEVNCWLLSIRIALSLLILSLMTASIRNLVAAHQLEIIGNYNLEKNSYKLQYIQIIEKANKINIPLTIIEYTSIISYCTSLTIFYSFIAFGLLAR